MPSKYYYQNCIDNYTGQISDNDRKIEALEDIKDIVYRGKSEEEQYLSASSESIAKLQDAKSEGVITYGEELKQYVSLGRQTTVLSYFDGITNRIDQKIQQLKDENSYLENEIGQCNSEIDRIVEEENKESGNNKSSTKVYK